MPLTEALIVIVAGLLAGFVNTLAGGGSMLTLPALLLTGMPVEIANGTNRVGVVAHSFAGSHGFRAAGQLDLRSAAIVIAPTLVGGLVGAWLAADVVPHAWLEPVLLGTMVVMAILMVVRPKSMAPAVGETEPRALYPGAVVGLFGAGVYGGFVQAGVGLVLIAVFGGLLRYDIVRSNALKVAATLVFNVVALAVFAYAGQVDWIAGGLLAASSVVGALIGVRATLRIDPRIIRVFILVAVIATCVAAALR